ISANIINISSLIHIIFIFFRLLLITFILIISFTHIGNDSFKWYTIHLYISFIPLEFMGFIQFIAHIIGYFHESFINCTRLSLCSWIRQFFAFLVEYEYSVMAVFIVFITFLSYVRPVFYRVWFVRRRWMSYFLIMHAISFLFTFLALASEFAVYFDELSITIRILDVVVTTVDYFLLIVLFALTGLFRTILLSICTLVALAPYRTAVMRIFRCVPKSAVTTIKTSRTSNIAYTSGKQ
uniref:G_PROTEIN_RECEP_F1_2 domain-containing protein n=1 Tax=Ascaris lumbricoides TaxID=6252 RepID=A0A0M3ILR6_ASCLU